MLGRNEFAHQTSGEITKPHLRQQKTSGGGFDFSWMSNDRIRSVLRKVSDVDPAEALAEVSMRSTTDSQVFFPSPRPVAAAPPEASADSWARFACRCFAKFSFRSS
mmetsp:Transcript_107916/g.285962  ORF Transcript_107916/g.285962 Transcript_107916/m.285962 type:complete len:106 (-) Transcript_107916:229-546(-)